MIRDVLLPHTDAGAITQAVAVLVVMSIAAWSARQNRDVLWFVMGLGVFVLALFALRTVH